MKENQHEQHVGHILPYFLQIIRIMRLSLFLLIVSTAMAFSAVTYSQSTRLTLEMENATVKEVFRAIEDQSDFLIFYREGQIDLNRRVSVHSDPKQLKEILDEIFKGTDNIYIISDRQVVIGRAPRKELEAQLTTLQKDIRTIIEQPQQKKITGKVTDTQGNPLPGATVIVKGTTIGTVTNADGNFSLAIPDDAETLQFSFIGMKSQQVAIEGRTTFTVVMEEETIGIEEVVVVGYGTQKKSDITGSVASVPKERLELVPNLNIAQAIQGSVPGVIIQTSSAGAAPDETFMIRGRNSITADNKPLIVVDGVAYEGNIMDINPNDVESIEILKDASSAAIYGSRGSNGVILVTTKSGVLGKPKFTYDGKYSMQNFTDRVEVLSGEEFYQIKQDVIENGEGYETWTQTELKNYEAGNWTDFQDIAMRDGHSQQHTLSVSGATDNVNYFISGNVLDVQGLVLKDDFLRFSGRVNLDVKIRDWLTIGTRSSLSHKDQSGTPAEFSNFHYGLIYGNPLLNTFEEDGVTPTVFPWPENTNWRNPLRQFLYTNSDLSNQLITNNYIDLSVPFIPGLKNRINTGIQKGYASLKEYRGRDTYEGFEFGGEAFLLENNNQNIIVEDILSYNREIGSHNIFVTAVFSYEGYKMESIDTYANRFANDVLIWHGIPQAENTQVTTDFLETTLLSQMLRLNYGYDNRYLITFTARRDGYSGFGSDTKWALFPSAAIAWNVHNEKFFSGNIFNVFKPKISYGIIGNQAVDPYNTIARLGARDIVSLGQTQPGFGPASLANEKLGWESSSTLNIGLDYGIFENRISGDFNLYRTHTSDLLLKRNISPIHGINSIIQNIGETQNDGLEFSFYSRNVATSHFRWNTRGNISFFKNKILKLYEDGGDDIANSWFIGHPIRVNYYYVMEGVWQEHEAAEAAQWGSKPGYVKLKDVNGNGDIDPDDRQIIGQQDPKMVWGLTNEFFYKNLSLNIFIHGVSGVTKPDMINERYITGMSNNIVKHGWWTPENPTNDMWSYMPNAHMMDGIEAKIFDDASFVRVKDVSLAYDLSAASLIQKIGLTKLSLYVTGRNLFTFTKWRHLDPELTSDYGIPLQREYVFGINFEF